MLRIKELCKEKGISLQTLAGKKLGITNQALYASINGNPTLERLEEIAAALGVTVPDLFAPPKECAITCPKCGAVLEVKEKE